MLTLCSAFAKLAILFLLLAYLAKQAECLLMRLAERWVKARILAARNPRLLAVAIWRLTPAKVKA